MIGFISSRSTSRKRLSSHGLMFALAFARGISSIAFGSTKQLASRHAKSLLLPFGAWARPSDHQSNPRRRDSLTRRRSFLPRAGGANEPRLFSSISRSEAEKLMTEDALAIVKKAIEAVDPYSAIRNHVHVNPETQELQVGASKVYSLDNYDDIVLVAFGKASSAMATAVVQQLDQAKNNHRKLNLQGVIIVKDDHGTSEEQKCLETHGILFREASHPVPDARSAAAAKEIMSVVSKTANSRTLVICCISGGGSALFCLPQEQLTLDDLQATNSVLLASGLDIKDMNVIRKRLEDGKGGRLSAAAYPSTVCSIVLSDVLGDPLDLIASGPTVPDTSSFEDAWRLVEKNNLQDKLPKKVVELLKDGISGNIPDSPSADHAVFSEGLCETVVVGNNEMAVEAAATEAELRGYDVKVLGSRVEGEAKHAANFYAAMAQQLSLQQDGSRKPFSLAKLPAALIAGGETVVTISADSNGKGGRNQELALAAALEFQGLGLKDIVLASVGTDGTDGPTDAAGAVVDGGTVSRLTGSAEDALLRHDAYTYLDQTEDDKHTPLIKTGPTGTNVADVCVVLVR